MDQGCHTALDFLFPTQVPFTGFKAGLDGTSDPWQGCYLTTGWIIKN